jgi:hypothetical protein
MYCSGELKWIILIASTNNLYRSGTEKSFHNAFLVTNVSAIIDAKIITCEQPKINIIKVIYHTIVIYRKSSRANAPVILLVSMEEASSTRTAFCQEVQD